MARHNVRDAQGRFTKAKTPKISGVRVLKARQTPTRLHAGRYVHDEAYDEEQHDMGPWIEFPRSTRVMAIRYDYQNQAVQVTWKRGGAPYIYLDVPYERFRSFIRANSQGKYINSAMNDYDKRPCTPDELDAPSNEQRSAQSPRQRMSDEPIYQDVLTVYLDLYRNQTPGQAELVVPAWAFRRLNELPEHKRREIMGEIDHIAALHGLQTPTKIIVAAPR